MRQIVITDWGQELRERCCTAREAAMCGAGRGRAKREQKWEAHHQVQIQVHKGNKENCKRCTKEEKDISRRNITRTNMLLQEANKKLDYIINLLREEELKYPFHNNYVQTFENNEPKN